MKFDIIITNPPYQLSDGGAGASATPIYQFFIQMAISLNPKYISMIIPSRWFAGGKGLDAFRKEMLKDKRIRLLVDYPNSSECFPNYEIAGGVCYFLWDSSYKENCLVRNISNGKLVSEQKRDLGEFDILVRNNQSLTIINKAREGRKDFLSDFVFPRNYFAIPTTIKQKEQSNGDIRCLTSKGDTFISPKSIQDKKGILNKFKVIATYAMSGGNKPKSNGKYQVLSSVLILKPNEACSETYLILNTFDDLESAQNFRSYVISKTFRFLLLQALTSIHITKDSFMFIPQLNYSQKWDDCKLNDLFGLSEKEQQLVTSLIEETN